MGEDLACKEGRCLAAVCGVYCGTCGEFPQDCRSCAYQLGHTQHGECPVYQCCLVERGLEHCGLCPDFPCQIFLALAEPMEVQRRYRSLLRRREIGTEAWLEEQRRMGER